MNEPKKRIDGKALYAWRLAAWVSAAVYFVIVAALVVLTWKFGWPWWIAAAAAGAAILAAIIEIMILPRLHYEQWRYEILEEEIELRHGIFIRKRTTIPMLRIQHVDTKQGPFLRKYGLATVSFATAAGSHEIPALTQQDAESVRNQIAALARVSDEEL